MSRKNIVLLVIFSVSFTPYVLFSADVANNSCGILEVIVV